MTVLHAASPAAATAAARAPLLVAASKAWAGHAEPAAGIVGMLHACTARSARSALPLLHLTHLNEHVGAALAQAAQAKGAGAGLGGAAGAAHCVLLPRALGPWGSSSGGSGSGARGEASGVSAFAFQGTNAHVLISDAPEQVRTCACARLCHARPRG